MYCAVIAKTCREVAYSRRTIAGGLIVELPENARLDGVPIQKRGAFYLLFALLKIAAGGVAIIALLLFFGLAVGVPN